MNKIELFVAVTFNIIYTVLLLLFFDVSINSLNAWIKIIIVVLISILFELLARYMENTHDDNS